MYLPVHNGRPRPPRRLHAGELPVSEHAADIARLGLGADPDRCLYCGVAAFLLDPRPLADAGLES